MVPKGSKITPTGSKVGPNGPKMQQTTLKLLKNRSIRLIRRSRAMNTLREHFGDLPKPRSTLRGHSFTLWVALKGLGRAKKGPKARFFVLFPLLSSLPKSPEILRPWTFHFLQNLRPSKLEMSEVLHLCDSEMPQNS